VFCESGVEIRGGMGLTMVEVAEGRIEEELLLSEFFSVLDHTTRLLVYQERRLLGPDGKILRVGYHVGEFEACDGRCWDAMRMWIGLLSGSKKL